MTPENQIGTNDERIIVLIATYQRPELLRECLASVAANSRHRLVDIVVVDNDPMSSAQVVVEEFSQDLAIKYSVQPVPGIAAARNRGLEFVQDVHRHIIFIDDDEYAARGWLDALIHMAKLTGAAVVTGPVISVFPNDAPQWVTKGKFHQRPRDLDGRLIHGAATNNTLVNVSAWFRLGKPKFDGTFSTTGGSDSNFFALFNEASCEMRYAAEAVVFEKVPHSRMSFRWICNRAIRNGVVASRVWRRKHSIFSIAGKGLWILLSGIILIMKDILLNRRLMAPSFNRALNGVGILSALTGYRLHEYRRSVETGSHLNPGPGETA